METKERTHDVPPELKVSPTVGRIVHYVLPEGKSQGEHRPAIVVHVWSHSHEYGGSVQLQVFTDSGEDRAYNDGLPQVMWATSVKFDPTAGDLGTWHWPEREA